MLLAQHDMFGLKLCSHPFFHRLQWAVILVGSGCIFAKLKETNVFFVLHECCPHHQQAS